MVNREVLKSIDPTHVFVCKWAMPLRWRFYKIILTDQPIVKCEFCNKFFHTDDFELYILQKGSCPYCRRARGGDSSAKQNIKNS